jgi:hypothetical protein
MLVSVVLEHWMLVVEEEGVKEVGKRGGGRSSCGDGGDGSRSGSHCSRSPCTPADRRRDRRTHSRPSVGVDASCDGRREQRRISRCVPSVPCARHARVSSWVRRWCRGLHGDDRSRRRVRREESDGRRADADGCGREGGVRCDLGGVLLDSRPRSSRHPREEGRRGEDGHGRSVRGDDRRASTGDVARRRWHVALLKSEPVHIVSTRREQEREARTGSSREGWRPCPEQARLQSSKSRRTSAAHHLISLTFDDDWQDMRRTRRASW